MAGNRNPNLAADDFLYLGPDFIGHRRIYHSAFLLFLQFLLAHTSFFPGYGALRHCQDGEAFSSLGTFGQGVAYNVDIVWDLREKYDVSASGQSCI